MPRTWSVGQLGQGLDKGLESIPAGSMGEANVALRFEQGELWTG